MNDSEQLGQTTSAEGEVGLVEAHDFHCPDALECELGGRLDAYSVRYETYGKLNKERNNAILICHALSGDHHCAGVHSLDDRKPGWWNNIIGPGKPIDTERFYVICSNCIGGCEGTTGPSSINPATGKPYAVDFPEITVRDMVTVQKRLLEHLGVPELYCVVGGSMGGMQVLQWGIQYPDFVRRLLPMATTARQNAQAIAFNEVGRCAIMQDPKWIDGHYPVDDPPAVGLAVARMMAHITYLSDKGMDNKFGRSKRGPGARKRLGDVEFEVESYLHYQGQSFVKRFDANTYLFFTKALDRYDLYGAHKNPDKALAAIQARTLVVGFRSDWLFPPEQNKAIVHSLLRCGKEATYAELDMEFGHDSFLVNAPALYQLVTAFLA